MSVLIVDVAKAILKSLSAVINSMQFSRNNFNAINAKLAVAWYASKTVGSFIENGYVKWENSAFLNVNQSSLSGCDVLILNISLMKGKVRNVGRNITLSGTFRTFNTFAGGEE